MKRIAITVICLGLLLGAAAVVQAQQGAANPNSFNRLMSKGEPCNQPPTEDGIHDPASPGTQQLQSPVLAFEPLPDTRAGNCVDWVQSLNADAIAPRWSRDDPNAKPMVFDLNIVREVKGSMPDVVYPHKQHTEWLDCSNCHPKIFVPKKGANQISMAAILLGEKCGVCHGKVAFPVSNCLRCHSRSKRAQAQPAADSGAPESGQ